MNENRIQYLDGLRGILAVIVFVHHFLYVFCPEIMLGGSYDNFLKPEWNIYKIIALTPVNILFNPGMAINFFFLLSGFVQSFQYFQKPELQTLQKSFIKRYFRLIIPTLAVVILIFVFHKLNFFHKGYLPKNDLTQVWIDSQLPDKFTFLNVLKYTFVDLVNGNSSYYQVLWTIPLEVLNSWLVLILLLITHKMKHKSFIFIFYTLVLLLVLQSFYSLSFLLGLLLCYFYVHSQTFKHFFSKPLVKRLCFLSGIYLASYPFVGYQNSAQHSMYKPLSFADHKPVLLFVFGNLLLFCTLLYSTRIKKFLEKRMFQFFGEISFMFYLTHFFILFSFSAVFYYSFRSTLSFSANVFITFVVSFLAITLVSYILYKCADKPVLQFLNRVVKKLFE